MTAIESECKALLGKQVRVYLDKPQANRPRAVIVEGTLLGFGLEGDFEIEDCRDGLVHYCWPMLEIEEIDPVGELTDGMLEL